MSLVSTGEYTVVRMDRMLVTHAARMSGIEHVVAITQRYRVTRGARVKRTVQWRERGMSRGLRWEIVLMLEWHDVRIKRLRGVWLQAGYVCRHMS